MVTERVVCDEDTALGDALGGQLLRHATILVLEIIDRVPAPSQMESAASQCSLPISNSVVDNSEPSVNSLLSTNNSESVLHSNHDMECETGETNLTNVLDDRPVGQSQSSELEVASQDECSELTGNVDDGTLSGGCTGVDLVSEHMR